MKSLRAVTGSRWFHPLLLLWVVVGASLRLTHLAAKPPWVDEFATIVFSLGHSFTTVPLDQAISIDTLLQPLQPDPSTGITDVVDGLLTHSNHPPLYFILAHLWMHLFPTEGGLVSMWAARSLPVLFGTLSIPAMFGLGYLAFRSRLVAQCCAAIMAVSPFGIFLAQEARHYTLAILFVIASICCLLVAVESIYRLTPFPLWVALTWVVVNTLGVATHYFFALTLCAEALVLLAVAWRQNKSGSETHVRRELGTIPQSKIKNTQSKIDKSWWRIFAVAAGTVAGSVVWLPILRSNYNSDLTHWIYDGDPLKSWLEPIGRMLAWSITMLVSLPMITTALRWEIAIASGVVTVLFLLWALPILWHGLKLEHYKPDIRVNIRVLASFIIGTLLLFFGITYTVGADLTLAPRYQFVFFPVAIALIGAALATSWNTPTNTAKMQSTLIEPPPSALHRFRTALYGKIAALPEPYSSLLPSPSSNKSQFRLPIFPRGSKKAVMLIWLMGVLGTLTVTWNLGYLQSVRPDFLVNVIQNVSNSPVLIATTHQHHGHTGRMMGVAWEFKHLDRKEFRSSGVQEFRREKKESTLKFIGNKTLNSFMGNSEHLNALAFNSSSLQATLPPSHEIASPQFLLARDAKSDSQAKKPAITLQETVAGLPRPLDVWLVNFHAEVDLTQQNCFASSQSLPKLDSYWYRLYRCPAIKK